jgi:hypothetical protein
MKNYLYELLGEVGIFGGGRWWDRRIKIENHSMI